MKLQQQNQHTSKNSESFVQENMKKPDLNMSYNISESQPTIRQSFQSVRQSSQSIMQTLKNE